MATRSQDVRISGGQGVCRSRGSEKGNAELEIIKIHDFFNFFAVNMLT